MEADTVGVALAPSSVLADKVIVRSVLVDGARVNIEGSPSDNNLTKILANVQAVAGSGSGATTSDGKPAGGGKKLQVDDLTIKNCKLSITLKLLGGKTVSAPLPDIHLSNLGQGPEGITPGRSHPGDSEQGNRAGWTGGAGRREEPWRKRHQRGQGHRRRRRRGRREGHQGHSGSLQEEVISLRWTWGNAGQTARKG